MEPLNLEDKYTKAHQKAFEHLSFLQERRNELKEACEEANSVWVAAYQALQERFSLKEASTGGDSTETSNTGSDSDETSNTSSDSDEPPTADLETANQKAKAASTKAKEDFATADADYRKYKSIYDKAEADYMTAMDQVEQARHKVKQDREEAEPLLTSPEKLAEQAVDLNIDPDIDIEALREKEKNVIIGSEYYISDAIKKYIAAVSDF